jgi:hypothetical protein
MPKSCLAGILSGSVAGYGRRETGLAIHRHIRHWNSRAVVDTFAHVRNRQYALALFLLLTTLVSRGACGLPEGLDKQELVFIYVHGFGEVKKTHAFEGKMNAFLKPMGLKASAVTFRWSEDKLKLTRVVHQWGEAKARADVASGELRNELEKLEKTKTRYVLVGYSLGCRVVAGALTDGGQLENLSGVYFMGAALPHDFKLETQRLPPGMKIVSYHSCWFDDVLKLSFSNAEGTRAGGEVGFDDDKLFENYRTACTHIHKGGLMQRDYSNLAPAIGALTLLREGIAAAGAPAKYNWEWRVGTGRVHWNDIARFEGGAQPVLIQQNLTTKHYRAVALGEDGKRTRKAWGTSLSGVLRKVGLFPEHS